MNNGTLVKVSATEHCITFRTVSRLHKSNRFMVTREELAELENKDTIISHDLYSFAIFRRNAPDGTLSICFTWLRGSGSCLSGREETVVLPYDGLTDFMSASIVENGTGEWKYLSAEPKHISPQLVFYASERLQECISRKAVRRKLVRFLRDNFQWPSSEKICFYYDFVPYSFLFREIRGGVPCMTGGLILHGQENMDKAFYSIHT